MQTKKAKKSTANIKDRLETIFSWCTLLDQLVGARPTAFNQIIEGSLQDFSLDVSKSLTAHWQRLCSTLSKISFAQDETLKASVARLRTPNSWFCASCCRCSQGTNGFGPLSGTDSLRLDTTDGTSSSVVANTDLVCASVTLAKLAEDVSIPAEGDM